MIEQKRSLFVVTCAGTLQNVEPPVSISIAHDVELTTSTVACPFAKSVSGEYGRVVKCVAPTPEVKVSNTKALKSPNCYQLENKGVFK